MASSPQESSDPAHGTGVRNAFNQGKELREKEQRWCLQEVCVRGEKTPHNHQGRLFVLGTAGHLRITWPSCPSN